MPELPDVEVFRERLESTSLNREIRTVSVDADRVLKDVSERTLRSRLKGGALTSTRRHGKHLFARIRGDGWLRLHFGMTGELVPYGEGDEPPGHVRLRLDFAGGDRLAYRNVRKLGEIGLVEDPDGFVEEKGLGPDALDLDREGFRRRLDGRRGAIKSTLMNQEVVAGIGNVYADEILFRARIHPETPIGELDDGALRRLHRAVGDVLQAAIDARVTDFPRSFLLPDREEGAPCPRCGTPLEKIRVSGRPTYFCPEDQGKGG